MASEGLGNALRGESITKEAIYDLQSISPTLVSHPVSKNLIDRSPSFISFIPKFSGKLKVRYSGSTSVKSEILVRSGRSRGSGEGEIFKLLSKDYVLSVGVLDDKKIHEGVETHVTYAKLFELLKHLGYDPLFPIRQESFIDSLEKRLGDTILQSLNKSTPDDSRKIRSKINSIGRQVVSFVKDYISGGEKPPLENKTISNRIWKDSNSSESLYPNGVDEPLSETGRLEDAIQYKVETYIRPERESFFEKLKEQKERRRNLQKQKKATGKGGQVKSLSVAEATKRINEYWDALYNPHLEEPNTLPTGLLAWRENAKSTYDKALKVSSDETSSIASSVRHYDKEIRSLLNEAKHFIKTRGKNVDETSEAFININYSSFDDLISQFGGKL